MSENKKEYIYIDLFSGCGGLALGMHQAGWKGLFAVEKNEDAFKTLRTNLIDTKSHFLWPDWLPLSVHDINTLTEKYREQLLQLSGKVTLVAGGPPCQGFSTAGRRNEMDFRNTLVDSYLKFIDLVNPETILFENVTGFAQTFKSDDNTKGKNFSTYIVEELRKRGYTVGFNMINFSDYGVPQRRVRFILLASKNLNPTVFFELLKKNSETFLISKKLSKRISIKSAISDLEKKHGTVTCPDSPSFKSGVYGTAYNSFQRYCRAGARKGTVPDSHRFANHKDATVDRFQKLLSLNIRDKNISNLLKLDYGVNKNCFSVLNAKLPSPTLTSNPDDHIHYSEPRTLTVREYARIQSFPDWYVFRGKYTTGGECRKMDVPRYTQIGNAIPPLFAEQVGLVLRQLLDLNK